eukprot:CAMPEP_0170512720 /NCGR_PEP_ID=MMETSP0208-20121228/67003_1 /TAXON_ID=197538 /ORGANISM="Strombidium inclinatum, Strain S3" /LENGTH=142 /DNA_ID=CAMNT_0010796381 /DNA_START=3701 /DNA_END=4129 /DNA_ORIENTATION=+
MPGMYEVQVALILPVGGSELKQRPLIRLYSSDKIVAEYDPSPYWVANPEFASLPTINQNIKIFEEQISSKETGPLNDIVGEEELNEENRLKEPKISQTMPRMAGERIDDEDEEQKLHEYLIRTGSKDHLSLQKERENLLLPK